jgi:hypothetical protein
MSITVPPVHFNPQNNHYIVVNAEMADNYNVGCHVDLTCTDKIVAFTTGVTLTYFDGNGQKLGTSKPSTLACGPAPLFNAAHASGDFTDNAPNGTQRIMVTQVAANDFGPIIQTIIDIATAIEKGFPQLPHDPTGQPLPDGPIDDLPDPNPPDPGPDDLRVKLTLSAKA